MKSKTFIDKQASRKTNKVLVETIRVAKKNDGWLEVAGLISGPRRNRVDVNLNSLGRELKEGEVIVVPGKVLSQGEIGKKIKVVALGFSEGAKEKLLNAKCEVLSIVEEIKKNPYFKGIKIWKKK